MKSTNASFASGWVLRPAVGFTLLYGGAIACWFLYLLATVRLPSIWSEETYRMISVEQYVLFTLGNAGLAIWLLASLFGAQRAPSGLRRGQLAGIVLSLVFLGVLQAGAQALLHPIPSATSDAAALEAHAAGLPVETRAAFDELRTALRSALPGHREVLFDGTIHFRGDNELGGTLAARNGFLRLSLEGRLPPDHGFANGEASDLERSPIALQHEGPRALVLRISTTPRPDLLALRDYLTRWAGE